MALSRNGKLMILGTAAVGLLTVLWFNVQESRTIVVQATPAPTAINTSSTVVGQLQAPRYTGQNARGDWELKAAQATQLASGNAGGASNASLALRDVEASWRPVDANPLTVSAPTARYNASSTELILPAGLTAVAETGAYRVILEAAQAQAQLSATTLTLAGGVSATLLPR